MDLLKDLSDIGTEGMTGHTLISDTNKENSSIGNRNFLTPKKRSSRLSILRSLDPYTSCLSDKKEQNLSIISDNEEVIDKYNKSDSSIDLLNFDASFIEGNFSGEQKNEHYDVFQNAFETTSIKSENLESNISMMLNESIEEFEDVATDNLIGLSPVKRVIEKGKFDEAERYLNKKKEERLAKELTYQNMLEEVKRENENKINDLLRENEEEMERMRCSHAKVLNREQLEFEEILRKLESSNAHVVAEKQAVNNKILRDTEVIHNEILARDSDLIAYMVSCDQYISIINELIAATKAEVDNLHKDSQQIDLYVPKLVKKSEKYEKTLSALKENQVSILEAISKYENLIAEFNEKVRESDKIVSETNEKTAEEIDEKKSKYEQRLNRLKVRADYLDNVKSNLKEEMELHVKSRDEMVELLESATNID